MAVVVFADSGRRDDARALAAIAGDARTEVVTVTLDVGQRRTLEDVRERALALGARRAHVIDAREPFLREFVWPAFAAGALQPGDGLGHALTAPLIARSLTEIAALEGASAVAHGARSRGGVARFAHALHALNPALDVVTLADLVRRDGLELLGDRDRQRFSRADESLEFPTRQVGERSHGARAHAAAETRADDPLEHGNLWERPIGPSGPLRTAAASDDDDRFPPSATIDIAFADGVPVGLNGVSLDPVELVVTLQTIAAAHGVGRVASSPRGIDLDASAAVVLCPAYAALRRDVLPADLDRLATDLGGRYAALIERGDWYGLTRQALDAFAASARRHLAGEVCVRLFAGRCEISAVRAIPADPRGVAVPASTGKDA
ncbi:MAG: argininosuccinate synthase [Acidobacteria bacterium]|nr:argininosuccinate synthase [Acidobacteriota bacterium]